MTASTRDAEALQERDVLGHVRAVAPKLQTEARRFADHPLVGEVRGVGLMTGIELVRDKATKGPFEPNAQVGTRIMKRALDHGLILRAIGDTIVFSPPLVTSEAEIAEIGTRFERTLGEISAEIAKA